MKKRYIVVPAIAAAIAVSCYMFAHKATKTAAHKADNTRIQVTISGFSPVLNRPKD